jgi:hypothetical protein
MSRHSGALIVALAVWLAPIPVGAKVVDLTGEEYLRRCTTTDPNSLPKNADEQDDAVFCLGYIEGAITVITAINGASFCIPDKTTPQDVLKATFAFMQARPDQKQYLFADVMLAAVLDHWPCQAK